MEDRENLMMDYDKEKAVILNNLSEEKEEKLFDPFFMEMIGLLGVRTAEMHLALSSIKGSKKFEEEPFSLLYQKSLYQSFRTLIKRTISQMKSSRKKLDEDQKALVDDIIEKERILLDTIKHTLEQKKIHTSKTRIHGDYHLGQVLFTGKDFVILDFEGEPTRSLTARSLKYCPLKDVAGMLRSFHYAIYMGELEYLKKIPESVEFLGPWLEVWYQKVYDTFMDHYLEAAGKASFIPEEKRQLDDLLSVYTIEKAIYEADYELNNRHDWLRIPLNGLTRILSELVEAKA
jgi:maltose alpha-D-glucosyltransferase/alpha-amylase